MSEDFTRAPEHAASTCLLYTSRVLQSCAAIEEHGHIEKPDENAPHAADLLRIDLKINVLLDLVGRLLASLSLIHI